MMISIAKTGIMKMLIDTGANLSIVKRSRIEGETLINRMEIISLFGITEEKIQTLGSCYAEVRMNGRIMNQKFHVVRDDFELEEDLDGIIGEDFLHKNDVILDFGRKSMTIPDGKSYGIGKIDAIEEIMEKAKEENYEILMSFQNGKMNHDEELHVTELMQIDVSNNKEDNEEMEVNFNKEDAPRSA